MLGFCNDEDEKLKWHENSQKTVLSTRVFDVTERNSTAYDGKTNGTYIVCNAPDWVIVIPVKEMNFLMVKQWRHGEKKLSLEFPGGVVEPDEEPEHAALRELLEETGCKPKKMTKLGFYNPNPALFSNHVHVFLAEDLEMTDEQNLDKDEFLDYLEIPQNEVLNAMGTQDVFHALMASALCLFVKNKNSNMLI